MLTCPNINTAEWKALEKEVGKFEAYRDYMETDGDIRSPEIVKQKIQDRTRAANSGAAYSAAYVEGDLLKEYDTPHANKQARYSTVTTAPNFIDVPVGLTGRIAIKGRITTDKIDVLITDNYWGEGGDSHIVLSSAEEMSRDQVDKEVQANQKAIEPLEDSVAVTYGYNDGVNDIIEDPRLRYESPNLADLVNLRQGKNAYFGITEDQVKNAAAVQLADQMSEQMGIEYEAVDAETALELTQNTKNPWSGEPAFFFGGKVYFVQDRMTTDLVFHEFAHPVVRALSKENPELFDRLYNELSKTSEGQDLIQQVLEQYPELEPSSELFREEVIVRALEKDGIELLGKKSPESPFAKFIKNLLYAIKRFLRGHFGKNISIAQLAPTTSLKDLAKILVEGKQISMNTDLVSDKDVVAYMREAYENLAEDLNNVRQRDIQDIVNSFYDTISVQLDKLIKDENYSELAELFVDQFSRGDYQSMKANLKDWQTTLNDAAQDLSESVQESRDRVHALTNTLFRLESVMEKMLFHIEDIAQEPDVRENMHKAHYYKQFLDHWDGFIQEFKEVIGNPENNVPKRSSITGLLADLETQMAQSRSYIDQMYAAGARDTLYEQLRPMGEAVDTKYQRMLKNLRDKKAPQSRIDALHKEYHGMTEAEYKRYNELLGMERLSRKQEEEKAMLNDLSRKGVSITKQKIEELLAGRMGDANFMNSQLEGYLYNADPVVGGLALYVKNAMNEVMIVTQQKYNNFAEDIREDLKAAGVNFNNVGKLGRDVGFKDIVATINDETGEIEKKEVWTFLNQFKNYRYDMANRKKMVEDSFNKWLDTNSDEDRIAYIREKQKYKRYMRTYFHQEYTDDFYEREEIFERDDIGGQAAEERDQIFQRMRLITEPSNNMTEKEEVNEELKLLWREYRQLHSPYYADGSPKSGRDAAIAERLREYREASREFYEDRLRKGVFENAYLDYLQSLRNKDVAENSAEWVEKVEAWKKANSRTVIKPEFYRQREEIIDKIKTILSKLQGKDQQDVDQAAIWEKINNLTSGYRDNDGQINGAEMEEGAIATVKSLQEKLDEIRENGLQRSGLTKAESKELGDLYIKKNQLKKKLTADEQARFQELMNKRQTQGLNKHDISILDGLYQKLAEMSTKNATVYYTDIINEWLGKLDTKALKAAHGIDQVDSESADYLLTPAIVEPLLRQNDQFREWFMANHIKREYFDSGLGDTVTSYERLSLWSVTKPVDENMMETYDIKDSEGNVIDTVAGLPNKDYYARVVNPVYKTRNIVGVTRDNQGKFLPKTREEMAKVEGLSDSERYQYINEEYENMRRNNKPMFELLEKLKRHHLGNQEGLNYSNRLYFDFPRMKMRGLELIQTSAADKAKERINALTALMRRVKDFFAGDKDDPQEGIRNYSEKFNLVRADMLDNDTTRVPIVGLFDLDVEDVSTDITLTMMRYMASAERHKQLVKASPVARAIQHTVTKNEVKDPTRINARDYKNRNIINFMTKKDNVRRKAVDNLIEREFEGVMQADIGNKYPWMNNFSNLLFKRASFSFFALNIPSALKNSLGMKFQSLIEGAAGEYVGLGDLRKGNVWSYKAMGDLSFRGELYKKGAKSHLQQMVDAFDMVQGRADEKFGEPLSRTGLRDVASMSWFFTPRKWVETQAGLQLAAGLLYREKVTQTMPDGTTKEIPYIDAFETIDGIIRLKKGIDVQYGLEPTTHTIQKDDTIQSIADKYGTTIEAVEKALDGRRLEDILEDIAEVEEDRADEMADLKLAVEDPTDPKFATAQQKYADAQAAINRKYDRKLEPFTLKIDNTKHKFVKNRMHQIANAMAGAYAKFDQPNAHRYIAFRFIAYMRRYFTAMAVNRWGFAGPVWNPRPRLNPGLGDAHMGFYVQFMKTLGQTVAKLGTNLPHLTSMEKAAAKRFFVEVGSLMALSAAIRFLFGFDPDDEDRFNKLRAKSDASGFLGLTVDDPNRMFDLMGYLELHALHLTMQVRAENEQFNLLTGGLYQYNSLTDIKSVAFGPTTDAFVQITDDLYKLITGDSKAYYSRDVGPYRWQQQESQKWMNHTAKMFGLSGTSLDPSLAIQNFQAYQATVRR